MHEEGVIGPRHVCGVDHPVHVFAENLAIVFRAGDTGACPVLGADEVGSLENK